MTIIRIVHRVGSIAGPDVLAPGLTIWTAQVDSI